MFSEGGAAAFFASFSCLKGGGAALFCRFRMFKEAAKPPFFASFRCLKGGEAAFLKVLDN